MSSDHTLSTAGARLNHCGESAALDPFNQAIDKC